MLAKRRFGLQVGEGTLQGLSDIPIDRAAYEIKTANPVALIVARHQNGYISIAAASSMTVSLPSGYNATTSRLFLLMRVDGIVQVTIASPAHTSSVFMLKGLTTQKGQYSTVDKISSITIYNPTASAVRLRYIVMEMPDITLAASFYDGGNINLPPVLVPSNVGTGRSVVATARIDYGSAPVTTGAWTQVFAAASVTAAVGYVSIFDSGGRTMELGTGGAGSESRLILIPPGGEDYALTIASGTRLSIRALGANATVGELDVNLFGVGS